MQYRGSGEWEWKEESKWEWQWEEEKLWEMHDEAMETIETTKNAAGKVRKKLAINVCARDATPQAW